MQQQHTGYRPGDFANGHQWTGTQWAEAPLFRAAPPGTPAPKLPWYRKPWAVVLASVLGAGVLLGMGQPQAQSQPQETPMPQEATR